VYAQVSAGKVSIPIKITGLLVKVSKAFVSTITASVAVSLPVFCAVRMYSMVSPAFTGTEVPVSLVLTFFSIFDIAIMGLPKVRIVPAGEHEIVLPSQRTVIVAVPATEEHIHPVSIPKVSVTETGWVIVSSEPRSDCRVTCFPCMATSEASLIYTDTVQAEIPSSQTQEELSVANDSVSDTVCANKNGDKPNKKVSPHIIKTVIYKFLDLKFNIYGYAPDWLTISLFRNIDSVPLTGKVLRPPISRGLPPYYAYYII